MRFYKITNEEERHNGMQYKTGLNVDVMPFNPTGVCEPGGIYFSREDILHFIEYGIWIREVTIPDGEPVYENPDFPKKWKAHRVILGERKRINIRIIKNLIKIGVNLKGCLHKIAIWASKQNHLNIIKWLHENYKQEFCEPHIIDDVFRFAASSGNIKILKYVLKNFNVQLYDNYLLPEVINHKQIKTLKFLRSIKYMFDEEVDNYIINRIIAVGDIEIIEFFTEMGFNVFQNPIKDIKTAIFHHRTNVIDLMVKKGLTKDLDFNYLIKYIIKQDNKGIFEYFFKNHLRFDDYKDLFIYSLKHNCYEIAKYIFENFTISEEELNEAIKYACELTYEADSDYILVWLFKNIQITSVAYNTAFNYGLEKNCNTILNCLDKWNHENK